MKYLNAGKGRTIVQIVITLIMQSSVEMINILAFPTGFFNGGEPSRLN